MAPAALFTLHQPASALPSGTAPARVVLVHGTLDRSTSFVRTMRLLPDLDLTTYDRRGYGRSRDTPPPATSLADHVDDLLQVLAGQPAVVVGHSYGGDVALAAAVRRPDLVPAVGAFEPPTPWVPWWPSDSAGGDAVRAAEEGTAEQAAEAFLRRLVGEEVWRGLPERTRQARRAEGPALLCDLRSIRAGTTPLDLGEVRVPVMLGFGELSEAHHRQAVPRLAAALPDAEVMEIAGARHGAHASHPVEFAQLVRRTVARRR